MEGNGSFGVSDGTPCGGCGYACDGGRCGRRRLWLGRSMMRVDLSRLEVRGEAMAAIAERMQTDIVTAMKAKDEHRLTTLRMVKSAMKNREIEKRAPLEEAEEQAILTTLIKQRKDSIEQFTKGGRPELAAKEQTEIEMIEGYLPQSAGEEEVRAIVLGALEHLAKDAGGVRPGPKDMGPAMRVVRQRILASGIRADGGMVSEMVKAELAK